MKDYLVFQLYAPLSSWGIEAVGEVRHTAVIPTRSALLGLLAAATGIKREEEERLNRFNRSYHVAVRSLSDQESWLRDYHSVTMPRENRKRIYHTRRDEWLLDPEELSTLITQREYRSDAYYHVAISAAPDADISLTQLLQALNHPHFPLYLGRKACPLALPLAPIILSGTLGGVFNQAISELPGRGAELFPLKLRSDALCHWDGPDEQGMQIVSSRLCNDNPVSRRRWQFEEYTRFSGWPQEAC